MLRILSTVVSTTIFTPRRYLKTHVSQVSIGDTGAVYDIFKTKRSNINTGQLFVALSDLENKYDIKLNTICRPTVVGSQSSGKSSVIEAIACCSILPKAMKMSTLKPVHLTTVRSVVTKFKIGDREFKSETEAKEEIDRQNENSAVKFITVIVWSPHVYNGSLVDLPGLFAISENNTNVELPKKIKDLNIQYLSDPNNLPVIIHGAPSDPATSHSLKLVKKLGREADTLGVITKMDMLEKQNTKYIENLLSGKQFQLGYGYCAVVLRNDEDINKGTSIEEKIKRETNFFAKLPHIRPAGVMKLREMISDMQYQKIKDQIPEIIHQVDTQIDALKHSQTFLDSLVNNDSKQLVGRLEVMLEKFYNSALQKARFEKKLKREIKNLVTAHIESIIPKVSKHELELSKNYIDPGVIAYQARNIFIFKNLKRFSNLFSYGLVSPVAINNEVLQSAFDKIKMIGICMTMIEPVIDDSLSEKKTDWVIKLNKCFNVLLENNSIHIILQDTTEKMLLEYIYENQESCDEITKKFAEYMIKEISNEAYESKIKFSIECLINMEKRPDVSMFDIATYLVKLFPNYFSGGLSNFIFREKKKIKT